MNSRFYTKKKKKDVRKYLRLGGLMMLIFGICGLIYIAFPLLSWQFYFSAFASEGVLSPVPDGSHDSDVYSLLSASTTQLAGVDYTNAENWYPSIEKDSQPARVPT